MLAVGGTQALRMGLEYSTSWVAAVWGLPTQRQVESDLLISKMFYIIQSRPQASIFT